MGVPEGTKRLLCSVTTKVRNICPYIDNSIRIASDISSVTASVKSVSIHSVKEHGPLQWLM
eukprot:4768952-Amphidinium_carterae.1